MIKYLFSDIDGTLYINDDVSPNDVKAAHKFVEHGGIFSMATGRADFEVKNFAAEEGFPKPRFRVSANGSMIVDGDEVMYVSGFSAQAKAFLKSHLAGIIEELSIVEVSSPDYVYFLMEPEDWVLNYKGNSYIVNSEALEDFDHPQFEILKMYVEGDVRLMEELVAIINEDYTDQIEIFNDITAMNLGPVGTNKGTAIVRIMEKYGIKPEEIATIGDAANDVGMFEITPNSFTFEHAASFIQEQASYIVKNVAEAVEVILSMNSKEK